MAGEPQYDNMVGKPLFEILSKLPTKSLLRFRCVSRLWREYIDDSYFASVHDKQVPEDPTLIIFRLKSNCNLAKPPLFHTVDPGTLNDYVLKAENKVGLLEFVDKKLLNRVCSIVGSCNGLVIIETRHKPMSTFTVIHPINKEYYVLPQLPSNFMSEPCNPDSCGLGFDSSTNSFKMVFVFDKANITMAHVFGTNSWHTIPQVPSYRIASSAIFAHGCVHWLASSCKDRARHVIWFDVKNEEFGLIKPPKRNNIYHMNAQLVNLDGQLGYFGDSTTLWLLNDKKEWMPHCDFKYHDFPPDSFIEVVGCLNKDGDILFKVTNWLRGGECIFIYNLKDRVMHAAGVGGLDLETGCKTKIVMFPNSLSDITRNSNLLKKKNSNLLKKKRLKKRKHEAFLADQHRIKSP